MEKWEMKTLERGSGRELEVGQVVRESSDLQLYMH